jgi:hypothetical protein
MVFGMIMSLIFLHFKAYQNLSKDEESYVQVQQSNRSLDVSKSGCYDWKHVS